MAKNLFVFDIETIADTSSASNLLSLDTASLSNQDIAKELEKYHLEITDGKNAFLRQPFHKVVCISYLYAKIEVIGGYEKYSFAHLGSAGSVEYTENSEKDLVEKFFAMIDKYKPKLVSFNGKTFDFPVLKYRAMKYGIPSDYAYSGEGTYNGVNYSSRYNLKDHCDLIDALSDFGASARIKLNEVCSIFGFPGKFGLDGSLVSEYFYQGKLKEIRDYCETDVLNTYLVYLRYALHTNKTSVEFYNEAILELISFLKASNYQIYMDFLNAWLVAHNNLQTKDKQVKILDSFEPIF
jgi:predicted PolB exonuclease-like 3'-5' exonuclease